MNKKIDQNKGYNQTSLNLDAAAIIKKIRSDLDMTQEEFAYFVKKPQSTIARIETCSMNVSIKLLNEIATNAHRQIKLVLI